MFTGLIEKVCQVKSLRRNGDSMNLNVELEKSTLGKLAAGAEVNIERAMKADGRFGGHFVQGHIDGTAKIKKIEQQGEFWRMRFSADKSLLEQMISKGSVAIDGISLTIAAMDEKGFEVSVIPETFKKTILSKAKVGDLVNIEIDLIVKVIQKQLSNVLPAKNGLTIDKLQELGF